MKPHVVLSALLSVAACGEAERTTLANGDDCYSPTQNLDVAYDAQRVGCACDPAREASACLPDSTNRLVALICDTGIWVAVNDGPCATTRAASCYAPYQNLDTAYDRGAEGCDCADDEGVCLPDSTQRLVALVCEEDRWLAVEDGPCGL